MYSFQNPMVFSYPYLCIDQGQGTLRFFGRPLQTLCKFGGLLFITCIEVEFCVVMKGSACYFSAQWHLGFNRKRGFINPFFPSFHCYDKRGLGKIVQQVFLQNHFSPYNCTVGKIQTCISIFCRYIDFNDKIREFYILLNQNDQLALLILIGQKL